MRSLRVVEEKPPYSDAARAFIELSEELSIKPRAPGFVGATGSDPELINGCFVAAHAGSVAGPVAPHATTDKRRSRE